MTTVAERVAILRKVPYLHSVEDDTLSELAARAKTARFKKGERIVGELESGADVCVLLEGEAEIFVEPRAGERQVLGRLTAGGAFGEMSSLTGELRSASVAALGPVEVLVIADADFDRLRERRPEVALALVRILAARLAESERALDALLAAESTDVATRAAANEQVRRGSISRAWRELVVNRRRDAAFLTLASFVLTLLAIRGGVYAAFRFDFAPRAVLQGAYLTGFGLILLSAAAALLTFRPDVRRAVAVAYGIGGALIFNQLGITLAFDIFFKDIHTPDPNVPFDIERLYRRTEGLRAIAIALVILVQAAYLRPFYRRVAFVIGTRLRKRRSG